MGHITFVHGILNKATKEELLQRWKQDLERAVHPIFLKDAGFSSSMVYWADVLYAEPDKNNFYESIEANFLSQSQILAEELGSLDSLAETEEEAKWLATLEAKLDLRLGEYPEASNQEVGPELHDDNLERILLPGFVKTAFMKAFLRDAHHYLFNSSHEPRPGKEYKVQDEIRKRFVADLKSNSGKSGPHIVISHSMGTVIAYDCLKRVTGCPKVDALITLGSPLGIDEIQDKLKPEWKRENGFPAETLKDDWSNFNDKLDVVSFLDPSLASDFLKENQEIISDVVQQHEGWWRHDITQYLKGEKVSRKIGELVGILSAV